MRRFFIKFEKLRFGPILGTFGTKSLKRFFCKNSPAPILFKLDVVLKSWKKSELAKNQNSRQTDKRAEGILQDLHFVVLNDPPNVFLLSCER